MSTVFFRAAGTATIQLTIPREKDEITTKTLEGCLLKKDANLSSFIKRNLKDQSANRNKLKQSKYLFYAPYSDPDGDPDSDFKGEVTEATLSYLRISKTWNETRQKMKDCTVKDPLIIRFHGHLFLCCDSQLNQSKFLDKYCKEVRISQSLDCSKTFFGLGSKENGQLVFTPFGMSQYQSSYGLLERRLDYEKLKDAGPLLEKDEETTYTVGYFKKKNDYRILVSIFGSNQVSGGSAEPSASGSQVAGPPTGPTTFSPGGLPSGQTPTPPPALKKIDYKKIDSGKDEFEVESGDKINVKKEDDEDDQEELKNLMVELAKEEKKKDDLERAQKRAQKKQKQELKEKIAKLKAENLDKESKIKSQKKIPMKNLHSFESPAKDKEKKLMKMGLSGSVHEDDSSGDESSGSSSSMDREWRRSPEEDDERNKSEKPEVCKKEQKQPQAQSSLMQEPIPGPSGMEAEDLTVNSDENEHERSEEGGIKDKGTNKEESLSTASVKSTPTEAEEHSNAQDSGEESSMTGVASEHGESPDAEKTPGIPVQESCSGCSGCAERDQKIKELQKTIKDQENQLKRRTGKKTKMPSTLKSNKGLSSTSDPSSQKRLDTTTYRLNQTLESPRNQGEVPQLRVEDDSKSPNEVEENSPSYTDILSAEVRADESICFQAYNAEIQSLRREINDLKFKIAAICQSTSSGVEVKSGSEVERLQNQNAEQTTTIKILSSLLATLSQQQSV